MKENCTYALAAHAAGHAVVGRVLNMSCGAASIANGHISAHGAISGSTWETCRGWARKGRPRGINSAMRGRIMTFMAGAEAEFVLTGQYRDGDDDDRWQIAMMIDEEGTGGGAGKMEGKLRGWARTLCQRHRPAIALVALALLRDGELTASEIDKMIFPGR